MTVGDFRSLAAEALRHELELHARATWKIERSQQRAKFEALSRIHFHVGAAQKKEKKSPGECE